MQAGLEISAVLPAHNEAKNLEAVVEQCLNVLAEHCTAFEIVIVDDGSSDGTADLADRLAGSNQRVKAVHHPTNRGYGAALSSGFAAASLPLIFFTDSDGQFDIRELAELLPHLDRTDMVIGYREYRQDPLHRRIYGAIFSAAVRGLFSVQARDVNCAFKVFRKSLLDEVELVSPGALINAELLALAKSRGIDSTEVSVTHLPRVFGTQSGGSPRVIFKAVAELIALKRRYPGT